MAKHETHTRKSNVHYKIMLNQFTKKIKSKMSFHFNKNHGQTK